MSDPLSPSSSSESSMLFRTLAAGAAGILLGAGLYIWLWPGHHEAQRFVVTKGESVHAIAHDLRDAHLIGSALMFRVWAKISGSRELHPGVYNVAPGWTGFHIYRQFRRGPPLIRVTFPEGWTSKQMAALLESKGITSASQFLAIVDHEKREGFLFPDTYSFVQGLDPGAVIAHMIRRFHEEEPKDMLARAQAMHLTYRQVVILASLVEREARVASERPLIAGVFYNRLKMHKRLESCATVEYALGAWKPQLTYKDLKVDSPYNTYEHAGLPPGPICNPGKASLEAAAHPEATEMMFFVAQGDGTHTFTKDYKEHLEVQKHPKKK